MSLVVSEMEGKAVAWHLGATPNRVSNALPVGGPMENDSLASIRISGPITKKGLYLPVMVCHPGGADLNDRVVHLAALIDTGAEYSAISTRVAEMIGLPVVPGGKKPFSTPTGIVELESYAAGILIPRSGPPDGSDQWEWLTMHTNLSGKANGTVSTDLLIGMDLISMGSLVTCTRVSWSFEVQRR